MHVRLAIDFENSAKNWWTNGGQDLWESILEGFDNSSVTLEESLARSWLSQAEQISGWDDGPEYAPHPIRLSPIDEDEEV